MQTLLTIHDNLHIIHKPMDDFQRLSDGHPALFLSETVEPLQHSLDLAFSQ